MIDVLYCLKKFSLIYVFTALALSDKNLYISIISDQSKSDLRVKNSRVHYERLNIKVKCQTCLFARNI